MFAGAPCIRRSVTNALLFSSGKDVKGRVFNAMIRMQVWYLWPDGCHVKWCRNGVMWVDLLRGVVRFYFELFKVVMCMIGLFVWPLFKLSSNFINGNYGMKPWHSVFYVMIKWMKFKTTVIKTSLNFWMAWKVSFKSINFITLFIRQVF